MTANLKLTQKVEEYKNEIANLQDIADKEIIEQTAVRLEKLNYAPPVFIPVNRFARLTKETLLDEVDKILAMPDQEACALAPDDPQKCQDLRLQFISVNIYYYKKLLSLRAGDPEEWDEIDELYVHD